MNWKPLAFCLIIVLVVLCMVMLTGQAPFTHNPNTGRMHGLPEVVFSYRENDPAVGTIKNYLVTGTPTSPPKARTSQTTSLNIAGICVYNCGLTGVATIAKMGEWLCEFDGPTTSRNFVVNSPTDAGKCHDSGISSNTVAWPTQGRIVAIVLSTNASAGTYLVTLFPIGTRGHIEGIKASATLDFPSLGGGLCTDLTMSVPGAVANDPVMFSLPADLSTATRSTFNAWVSATDTVTVRHCSINGSNNPPSAVYNVVVVK